MTERGVYPIEINGVKRNLPKFEVKPGLTIAILNILGDAELVHAAAQALAPKIAEKQPIALVTAEAKSIPLAYAVSRELNNLPYIVLRKSLKPYMGDALKSMTLSITTGEPQTLYLDEKDRELVEGGRVVILDDVISTGSTLQGMRAILEEANAEVVAEAAILTEGDEAEWAGIISLGHLPVWVDD